MIDTGPYFVVASEHNLTFGQRRSIVGARLLADAEFKEAYGETEDNKYETWFEPMEYVGDYRQVAEGRDGKPFFTGIDIRWSI